MEYSSCSRGVGRVCAKALEVVRAIFEVVDLLTVVQLDRRKSGGKSVDVENRVPLGLFTEVATSVRSVPRAQS
jgi:hypothetical protein